MKVEFEPGQEFWIKLEYIISNVIDQKIEEMNGDDDGTITVKEAAKLLNVAEITVHEYIKKGLLPAKKIRRKYIIEKADVMESLKDVKSLKYQRT